jgi:tRNA-splicing ligase RtcB
MNKKQLMALGVPEDCVKTAVGCIHAAATSGALRRIKPKQLIPELVADPQSFSEHAIFAALANELIEYHQPGAVKEPIEFAQWGEEIDEPCKRQMHDACRLPVAAAAALMPDAHLGYGLPIGGVLACDHAVVPYAVGVDIACRMRLSITDLDPSLLDANDKQACRELDSALEKGTLFGTGKGWQRSNTMRRNDHPVLDEDWTVTAITRQVRDTACNQLGTSGSGNHFAEWGIVELPEADLGLEAGRYVGLLSHSGSRGAGAQVCRRYTDIASKNLSARDKQNKAFKNLAWLSLDSEAGQEYWLAMNLMGRYAAANHEVIHRNVNKLAGARAIATVENHHNFAWKERHGDRDLIVHRKGATPAHAGELGVIPGNMADPAFIVRGKGVVASLGSASHGAGRCMSRRAAKEKFRWQMWKDYLSKRNVRLLAGGLDEVPGAYKNIHDVMAAQSDLVDVVGRFHPKIVMMCGDGSPAED